MSRGDSMSEERNRAAALDSLIKAGPALLRDLYDLPEPIASVYFSMADPTGDDVALRRRMVRHHLLRAATGTVVLGAVEEALGDVPQGPGAVAVFVGRDGSVRTFTMPEADLTTDRVSRSALPEVVPFLRWQQYRPAYVLAALGRTGTEVSVRHSPWSEVTTITVPAPGDGNGNGNGNGASEAVTDALSSSGARLLIVTGDARAVQSFQGRLPAWALQRVQVEAVPEERRTQADRGKTTPVDLAAMVDARLRETVAAVINGSDPENGGDAPAGQGVSEVIRALARGELRELLVGSGGAEDSAWFGPGPTDIAETASGLDVPDTEKRHGPVADVLIRAATLTDAEVAILPVEMSEALHQGVGGIRR
ncbi:hypothetical protein ABIA31_006764 [Catenulispora sp. MAP5-51]